MPTRRRPPRDVQAQRPAKPYLANGSLNPREWKIACSAANVLAAVLLHDQPWFIKAQPVHVVGQGVELEVVVRWSSSEVYEAVPASVDGYPVNVVVDGQTSELHTVH